MPSREHPSLETRRRRLRTLARDVAVCPRCPELVENRTQPVFGCGPPDAELMLVGEAPGREEDRRGEPFVGQAGRKLDELLAEVGLDRRQVFITNAIKCRPPHNRKPHADELQNCRPYLDEQIELIRPSAIGTMGSVPAQSLLDTRQRLERLRGRVHDFQGLPLVCTYHPAYVRRSPAVEPDFCDDLRLLLEQINVTR